MTREKTTPPPEPAHTAGLGLRERGKLDKRRRIKAAARATFLEKGYEAATTREIAIRADVAIGTLFVYAKDKRDLLLMIVNDDLEDVTERALSALQMKAPLLDQVTEFFRIRYEFWASEPRLSRPAIQETFGFLSDADHGDGEADRFYARRARTVAALTQMVTNKQSEGEVTSDEAPGLIASLLMTIYVTEVRRWLASPVPDFNAGVARLRDVLRLAMKGIYPHNPQNAAGQVPAAGARPSRPKPPTKPAASKT